MTLALAKRRPGIDTLPFHKILDPRFSETVNTIVKMNRFPGSLCVSIERKDIPTVKNKPFWVCEKSDGTRFLLVVTKFDGLNVAALVGRRADDIYAIKLQKVPRDLYKGTVLDGEMVLDKQTNRQTFLAFDALLVAGRDVRDRPFSERYLDMCAAMMHYEPHERDSIAFKVKTFFPVPRLNECMDSRRDAVRSRFGWDGLIFTPENHPVVAGRNFHMFKWKPVDLITIDFCVNQDGRTLLVNDQTGLVPVGTLDEPAEPGSVVECTLTNAHEAMWHVYRVRSDKSYPNDMLTFTRTLANIQEAIVLEDFYDRK